MPLELAPLKTISSLPALQALAEQLQHEPLIAVDTESNSLFAYRERVCLVQISTRAQDWIIDPLAIDDLSPLGPLLADPAIEKVFHAAEYDIMCLKRDYGFRFANLFDTMVAARIIGRKTFGLANMLDEYFGVRLNKRFQRADWSVRPIPPDQLEYARQDTHYLPALRDILRKEIEAKGLLAEARESFDLLTEAPPASRTFDPDAYWRINGARDFTRRQMAMLRELYLLREQIASQRDQPPFKIMSDEAMISIVQAAPRQLSDLYEARGLGRALVERYGNAILKALRQGQTGPLPQRPDQAPRVDALTMARFNALRDWRKARAAERGVESDVIIPKDALWALARSAPQSLDELEQIAGLGPWRRETYGREILTVLAGVVLPEQDT